MKCDELKEYYYYEDRVITPATHMYRVYHADEVDTAIEEVMTGVKDAETALNEAQEAADAILIDYR